LLWHECQHLHLPIAQSLLGHVRIRKKSFQHGFATAFKKTKNEALRVELSKRMDTSPTCRVEKLPAYLYIRDGGPFENRNRASHFVLTPRGIPHRQPKSCTWMRSSALHLPSLRYKFIRDLRCKSHFERNLYSMCKARRADITVQVNSIGARQIINRPEYRAWHGRVEG
jgi:hypothetical protein